MFKSFNDLIKQPPTLENPFICIINEIIEYDADQEHILVTVQDQKKQVIIGFLYKKFAQLLSDVQIQKKLPITITVIRGKLVEMGDKNVFEIFQCIFDKYTLINSTSVSGFSFCPSSIYLRNYLRIEGDLNSNLITGILIHDYLSIVFDDRDLLSMKPKSSGIKNKVLRAYEQAVYNNWQILTACGLNEEDAIDDFKKYVLEREVEFINYELDKFALTDDEYIYENEKMIRSKNLGFQGRIDRLLWNRTSNNFTIYETKTGKSSISSQETAQYQLITYSIILREYYKHELEELILEYPRKELENRLSIIDYDEDMFFRLVSMRNEIWAISTVGKRPEFGPYMHCGRCFQKDACGFYCFKENLARYCQGCSSCSYTEIHKNKELFNEYRRINVYYDWFFEHLNREYVKNMETLAELNLDARERESLGNCIADLVINKIHDENLNDENKILSSGQLQIEFIKKNIENSPHFKDDFSGTRLNKGDFITITPQNYEPLTVQSYYGIIKSFKKEKIIISCKYDDKNELIDYTKDTPFRLDAWASNNLINLMKSGLDNILRMPYKPNYEDLRRIRNILLKLENREEEQIIPSINLSKSQIKKIKEFLISNNFNNEQIKAILRALEFTGILLVLGPPGSGKTTVIAEIIYNINKYLTSNNIQTEINEDKKDSDLNNEYYRKNNEEEPYLKYEIETGKIKKKILITAFTHRAVDNIIEKLLKKYPDQNIVRLGSISSISNEVKSLSLENLSLKNIKLSDGMNYNLHSSKNAKEILDYADIIACTCLGARTNLLTNYEFEYLIIDEGGQIIEPSAILPILKAKNVIIIGDDKQLPPISQTSEDLEFDDNFFNSKPYLADFKDIGENSSLMGIQTSDAKLNMKRRKIFNQELENLGLSLDKNMSTSIFERLNNLYSESNNFIAFTEQYRMNKVISDFVSKNFYGNNLKPGKMDDIDIGSISLKSFFNDLINDVDFSDLNSIPKDLIKDFNQEEIYQFSFNFNNPVVFLDTRDLKAFDSKIDERYDDLSSRFNDYEAKIVSMLVRWIINKIDEKSNGNQEIIRHLLDNLGVITPYRAQIRLIRNKVYDKLINYLLDKSIDPDNIRVDTVDKFQGGEREIIIMSLVDSNPQLKFSEIVKEIRRLNVSISRAKTKLIVIGNSEMFMDKSEIEQMSKSDSMINEKMEKRKPITIMDFIDTSQNNIEKRGNKQKIEIILKNLVKHSMKHNGYLKLSQFSQID